MTTIDFYNDPVDGKRVMRTDYSQPAAPSLLTDVKHEYEPMKPDEAVRWALIFGALCGVGALAWTVMSVVNRFMPPEQPTIQSSIITAVPLPFPWIAAFSVPVYILMNAYRQRIRYEDGMLRRFAPAPKPARDRGQVVIDDDDEDEDQDAAWNEDDEILYDEMAAILVYAHKNGGPAPTPNTERNGVASLPLTGTGGTLDANGYAVPANQLQKYGLLTHGKNNIWQLADKWQDKTLDELSAELKRKAEAHG